MKLIAVSSIALILLNQIHAKPIAGCLLNYTITTTDSCVSVAAQFQLTDADFYAMNPGLHHSAAHDCDNLDTGKPVCVCLTAPCPVSLASNTTVTTTAASESSSVASLSSSVTVSSTAVTSSTTAASSTVAVSSSAAASSSVASSTAPASTVVASTSETSAAAASSSVSSTSSAPTTKIFGAVVVGLVLAATSALV